MDKYVFGMYGNEDQLDNHDRLYNKFLDIFVLNPRTHIKRRRALYTDYEVHVKTNHPEFAIKDSQVRRRYSEFAWLKARLGMNDIMMTTAPSLPGKKYVGRFKDPFLMKRQMGLQHFMNKVVEVNPFLSDPALHLFLQTELSISQMESYLKHSVLLSNIRDRVIAEQKLREQRKKNNEDNMNELACSDQNCLLTRSLSLDTILSLRKDEKTNEKAPGRGWSNFIGERGQRNQVFADRDVIDFHRFGSSETYHKESKKTACVLPGGQLQLADTDDSCDRVDGFEPSKHRRSASWHGKTLDMIDFLLDSYDVIDIDKASTIDSFSVSQYSNPNSNSSGTLDDNDSYSDDGIEIDIDSRLSEYTIISPLTSPNKNEMPYGRQLLEAVEESLNNGHDMVLKSPTPSLRSNAPKVIQQTSENTFASLDTEGFHHSDSDSFSS
ncbi:uncharacterized protein [Clytia hemisphaerica]|uniref:PX domain-containing protein n=1 Tax=Clytia hemisphaerica TaxID=252671 RepID=A0A7M5WI28_9CNID